MDALPRDSPHGARDALVESAARNNALWCDAVCRAYGARGELTPAAWVNRHRTPPFYGNLVTLTADGVGEQLQLVRELIDLPLGGGWGVKDSFHGLNLSPVGFETLFHATWLAGPASGAPATSSSDLAWTRASSPRDLQWTRASSPRDLQEWEEAWRSDPANGLPADEPRVFRPALLGDPGLAFVTVRRAGAVVAVAACNRTDDVVGVSNLSTLGCPDDGLRAGCIAAARSIFPGRTLVGYEPDDAVQALVELGFEAIAPLRVWRKIDRIEPAS